jgi:hypothetical protein
MAAKGGEKKSAVQKGHARMNPQRIDVTRIDVKRADVKRIDVKAKAAEEKAVAAKEKAVAGAVSHVSGRPSDGVDWIMLLPVFSALIFAACWVVLGGRGRKRAAGFAKRY